MDSKTKRYLRNACRQGGWTDKSGDYGVIGPLEKTGLVTVKETLIGIRGEGVAPVPHLEATAKGHRLNSLG